MPEESARSSAGRQRRSNWLAGGVRLYENAAWQMRNHWLTGMSIRTLKTYVGSAGGLPVHYHVVSTNTHVFFSILFLPSRCFLIRHIFLRATLEHAWASQKK